MLILGDSPTVLFVSQSVGWIGNAGRNGSRDGSDIQDIAGMQDHHRPQATFLWRHAGDCDPNGDFPASRVWSLISASRYSPITATTPFAMVRGVRDSVALISLANYPDRCPPPRPQRRRTQHGTACHVASPLIVSTIALFRIVPVSLQSDTSLYLTYRCVDPTRWWFC